MCLFTICSQLSQKRSLCWKGMSIWSSKSYSWKTDHFQSIFHTQVGDLKLWSFKKLKFTIFSGFCNIQETIWHQFQNEGSIKFYSFFCLLQFKLFYEILYIPIRILQKIIFPAAWKNKQFIIRAHIQNGGLKLLRSRGLKFFTLISLLFYCWKKV